MLHPATSDVSGNEPHRSLRKPENIENSEQTYQRDPQGIDSERLRAQHPGQIYFEKISGNRGENGAQKKNRGMAGDMSDLLAKLPIMSERRVRRGCFDNCALNRLCGSWTRAHRDFGLETSPARLTL